ncbi:MAG: TonB-dependent receptor [Sphingobacteriia bacterium]
MRVRFWFLFATLLLLPVGHRLHAQALLRIQGVVADEDNSPLAGATVELHETHQGALSDSLGQFLLDRVRPAHYHLHVSMNGYRPHQRDLHLEDSTSQQGVISLRIQLFPTELELETIHVEGDALKIDARRQSLNVQYLDAAYLSKNANTNLLQTLAYTPGLSYINTGTGIAKPVIRGLAFNRIAVVQHGVRQEGQQWGQDHGLEIDAFSAGGVQILKGPAALVYGPQAIGGVLDILPEPEPEENTLEAQAEAGYMSLNENYWQSTKLALHRGPWLGSLRFSTQDYADYRVPATTFNYNRFVLPIYSNRLKNTAGRERNVSAMLGRHGAWGYSHLYVSHFDQQAGIFIGAVGIPNVLNTAPDGDSRNIGLPYQRTRHLKMVSKSNLILGKDWLELELGYQRKLRQEFSFPDAHGRPAAGNLALQLLLHSYSLNARLYQHWLPGKQGVLGVQAQGQTHRVEGFEFLFPAFRQGQLGVYLLQEWEWKQKWFVNAGLRADWGQIQTDPYRSVFVRNGQPDETTQSGPALDRSFGNVAASAGLSWFPLEALNLKLNLGSYFRFPQPYELSANGVHHGSFRHEQGNAELNTERGWQLDAGLYWTRKRLQLSATPFLSYFDNYLYLTPTARFSPLPDARQLYRYAQDPALLYGGELQADWHLGRLHLGAGYTYLYGQNLGENLPLPFMPPNRWVADAEYTFRDWKGLRSPYLRLASQWVLAQGRVVRNEPATPGYTLWSASAGVTTQWGRLRLLWSLTVQNLADVRYFHHLSRYRFLNLPEPGRNLLIRLSVPLTHSLRS